ncbi:hypothetical protein BWK59_13860, partial [Flavobacterium davisii]
SKGSVFSFTEKLRAKAHCVNMFNKEILFTLWEDDAKGSGHNASNKLIDIKKAKVDLYGNVVVDFMLTKALMKKAMQGEADIRELEFYVTVEYYRNKKHTTANVDIQNPLPTENTPPSQSTGIKKAKGSPAEEKPKSKKEESGLLNPISETLGEIWDWVETQGTALRDKPHTIEIPEGKSPAIVGKTKGVKKEKFKPVIGNGEEAVIYITSEIATEIEVDKNGKVISYPDYGAYNGQEEFKIDDKIYCKKIKVGKDTKSAFPTYKAYIYRGNTVGEAVKKLKQDIKFNTHENAESTVLEVARHTLGNNKDYKSKGPTPPNNIDKLYRLKYQFGSNNGKTSYRYRIVDNNSSSFPTIKDYKKEYQSGSMNIGSRSSISIDPWDSSTLIGCIGIRGEKGTFHSSYKALTPQQKKTYKNKYHCINNYLETIIPELTGIYGRRGYSSTDDIAVVESSYTEEIKVFVLIDPLKELCNCIKLKNDGREEFYNSFGTKTINYIDKKSNANKFKALYMIAQRRQENGFTKNVIGNNPMNIKGNGDLGQVAIDTHETLKNGEYVPVKGEKFANFSSEDAGFKGYIDLLESNFNDAYKSLFDDSKTIDDFTTGLEDTGKKGPYATGKAQGGLSGTDDYKKKVKVLFEGVKKDYIKIYECKLCKEKDSKKKEEIKNDLDLLKKLK